MAVCFGHQIVGRAYGETAERNPLGWEVSVTSVTLSETGKRVFGCDSLVCLFTLWLACWTVLTRIQWLAGASSDASRRRPAVSSVRQEARPFRPVRGAGDLRHEPGS
ncbi:hypothetical protein ASPFODRAFT_48989 [Aspergillus luchuensis CBS 106.47]|uniref:Glutamine amidotransferase domain-containing protein n=1 Tax=Aspergillus luchuensis (strain CBS 106.47) TaxID=1137211 RepID=A0A1M3TA02_ASPLC|nr:hypothetical protein ASPFODRAFT_48989 [Aspergillus luchuensis CBS 106.47]